MSALSRVPVTVKDNEGKLEEGLLEKRFLILENGVPQKTHLLHQRSFSLAAALIIDQGLPDPTDENQSDIRGARGAFGPFDKVAVFTYGNTVNKRQDFGNTTSGWRSPCNVSEGESGEMPELQLWAGRSAGPIDQQQTDTRSDRK